jgi:hypothetical protein
MKNIFDWIPVQGRNDKRVFGFLQTKQASGWPVFRNGGPWILLLAAVVAEAL